MLTKEQLKLFKEKYEPTSPALQINNLIHERNSPGRIFNMTEEDFRQKLENLNKKGYAYLESSADLDQIRFKNKQSSMEIIKEYYRGG